MAEVEFNNERPLASYGESPKGLADRLIRKGFARDGKQANFVLLIVLVVVSLAVLSVLFFGRTPSLENPPSTLVDRAQPVGNIQE